MPYVDGTESLVSPTIRAYVLAISHIYLQHTLWPLRLEFCSMKNSVFVERTTVQVVEQSNRTLEKPDDRVNVVCVHIKRNWPCLSVCSVKRIMGHKIQKRTIHLAIDFGGSWLRHCKLLYQESVDQCTRKEISRTFIYRKTIYRCSTKFNLKQIPACRKSFPSRLLLGQSFRECKDILSFHPFRLPHFSGEGVTYLYRRRGLEESTVTPS